MVVLAPLTNEKLRARRSHFRLHFIHGAYYRAEDPCGRLKAFNLSSGFLFLFFLWSIVDALHRSLNTSLSHAEHVAADDGS